MSDYSAASIRVLKDLEPVKERPGMYTRTTCPTHIVQEVIDNAADEALAGFAKKISVTIKADGDFIIDLDHIDESARKPVLERLRTQLEGAFSEVWSEKATARFDFELADI
jgi:hypothetical protein